MIERAARIHFGMIFGPSIRQRHDDIRVAAAHEERLPWLDQAGRGRSCDQIREVSSRVPGRG